MKEFLTALDQHCGPLFIDSDEPAGMSLSLCFRMDADIDLTKPVIPQVRRWMAKCVSDIECVTEGLSQIEVDPGSVRS